MIKIENTEVFGWEAAIRGMRNPLNSWDKSDSEFYRDMDYGCHGNCPCLAIEGCDCCFVGPNDLTLMKDLVKAGSDHSKFMRMINVTMDVTAPLYWWKEFDTYKVGTVANSCSTMHKIHEKPFTRDDFSCEHLFKYAAIYQTERPTLSILEGIINCLNLYREEFIDTKNKEYWWQMIQLLPSSYNQKRTIQLNYAVLRNMYHSRKNHKLDEWKAFCEWIETLPYSELITL